MTCLYDGPLVVILILGLTMFDLWTMLFISLIFLGDRVGNESLMQIISSTLIFEVYAYDFLLNGFISLFLFNVTGLVGGLDLEMLETVVEFLTKNEDALMKRPAVVSSEPVLARLIDRID